METFCKDLREHAMKTINYKKKEMIPLTDEENESYEKQKVCYILKNNLILMNLILMKMIKMNLILMKMIKMNLILTKIHLNHTIKSEIIVITLENLEELLIIFVI